MKISVSKNANNLIRMAQEDFLFTPDEDQTPRFVQAFLLQACVIEGLAKEFCSASNKKNKINKMKAPGTFKQSAREARVGGNLNEKEFELLREYINFRNTIVHTIIENNIKELEEEIDTKYNQGLDIFNFLLNKKM